MRRRRVTVFGGSGFIGRHLVNRLAARGDIVTVAVRDPEAAIFLKPMGDVGQIVIVATDICNPASVAAAVKGADAVVNLVGILWQWGRRSFTRIHAKGAGNIARAAREAGVARLVHVSAIGADKDGEALYARSKAAGEVAVRDAFPAATILRPSVVFGPEDNFFNQFADLARDLPALPIFGRGDGPSFQPVYVGDVADAIMTVLTAATAQGRTFELGGPRIYTYRQLMELVLSEIGRHRMLVPVPIALAAIAGWFLQKLPNPLLTRDQMLLLKHDNIVADGAATLADLGIVPTAAETVLPAYLRCFRRPQIRMPRPV